MDNLYILIFKRLTVLLENIKKEKIDIKLDDNDMQER